MMTQDTEGSEMTIVTNGRVARTINQLRAAGATIALLAALTQGCATREQSLAQASASEGTVVRAAGEALPMCKEVENGPQCPVGDGGSERNGSIVFFDFDEPDFGGAP